MAEPGLTFMLEALCLALDRPMDGDSFWTCQGDNIRLVAASGPLDAPERQYRRGRWNDKPRAEKATVRLAELLDGATLICSGKRDRYQRHLCRAENGGRDVGDRLVSEGLAVIRDDWR